MADEEEDIGIRMMLKVIMRPCYGGDREDTGMFMKQRWKTCYETISRPDPRDEADSGDPARTTRIALQGK